MAALHFLDRNIPYQGGITTTKIVMVRLASRYATSLYGKELMVLMTETSLESMAQHLPYFVSTFKPKDSMTFIGIIALEAPKSTIQFFKVFPFTNRLKRKGSISSTTDVIALSKYLGGIWETIPLDSLGLGVYLAFSSMTFFLVLH